MLESDASGWIMHVYTRCKVSRGVLGKNFGVKFKITRLRQEKKVYIYFEVLETRITTEYKNSCLVSLFNLTLCNTCATEGSGFLRVLHPL